MIPEKLKKRVSYARFDTHSIGISVVCQTEVARVLIWSSQVSLGFSSQSRLLFVLGIDSENID